MRAILQSVYAKYFLWALLVTIITAWFSVGHHNPDEHFQILEFANYKLGNSPAADLPWEFPAKERPGLQPFIAYCLISAFNFAGIYSPFIITFLLRLIIGLLGWFVACKLVMLLLPTFYTNKAKKIFVLLSFFLWFIPYINVRFSSENTATISFLYALHFLLKVHDNNLQKNISFFLAGVLLILSFFFRFQMAFAIMGLSIWLLLIKKIFWQNWLTIILGSVCAFVICVCIDHWMYNAWVFTPYNYYETQIVKHIAADFGTNPWWYYLSLFINLAIPPLSVVLLYFFGVGIYSKPKSVFVFILIPFIIGHSIIGHKEMRFMFPMWFAFVYVTAIGIDFCIRKYKPHKFFTISFKALVVLNFCALLYRVVAPAQEAMPCFKFVKDEFKQPTTILCIGEPMFNLSTLKVNFYKPKSITETVFKDETGLNNFLITNTQDSVIVFKKAARLTSIPVNYTSKRIYCLFPDWILKFNYTNWQERVNVWSIYILYKKK